MSARNCYYEPRPCVVLPYMDNGSLSNYLESKTLNDKAKHFIAFSLASGLCYLHNEKGIAHYDLKCDNILVGKDEKDIKINDFGLSSKVIDKSGFEDLSPRGAF